MATFELRLADGRVVTWEGADAVEAATRYVDVHRESVVVAWRTYPRHGLFIGAPLEIIEPGLQSSTR